MKLSTIIFPVIILTSALVFTACGGGGEEQPAAETLERPEPPPEYAGKTNPKAGDPAAAEEGAAIFARNCVSCHGETGRGDGPAGAALDPAPKNLAENQRGLDDDYLFWHISEGGIIDPFNSAMPPWKGVLDEEEIWEVIAFLRTLE